MTHQGSVALPGSRVGTGLFLSGIVLGFVLGLAAGHLLLFAPNRSAQNGTTAEEEFAQLVASTPRFAAVDGPLSIGDSQGSILEFDAPDDVGRVRLSDQPSDDEHLHFFPEVLHAPVEWPVSQTEPPAQRRSTLAGPLQMTADMSQASDTAPQALQPPPAAAPIDKSTLDRQSIAQTIIRNELPDATTQEREVWLEVLQGLPAEDIKGILRMRKHVGPQGALDLYPSLLLPTPLAGPTDPVGEPAAPPPDSQEASDVARRVQLLTWHNLANRNTVAYKQLIAVCFEAATDDPAGIGSHHEIRDMRQGELQATGRTLDLALDGPGFLQVRRGDEVRYTRDGRLTLDAKRRLKLLAPADNWLIDPPITIPADAISVVISDRGEVVATLPDDTESIAGTLRIASFLDPSALDTMPEGLYQPTTASGVPQQVSAARAASTLVVQGHVERSNVVGPQPQAGRGNDADTVRR